jgi:aspartyl-tRNA(Asn)/glutamyl-tRNA(Gln) amidotransferase subunit B
VPLAPTEDMLASAREALPELPAERRERYLSELGLPEKQATQLAFAAELGSFYEDALAAADGTSATAIANWVTGDLVARLRDAGEDDSDPASSKVTPQAIAALAGMAESKAVSSTAARQVLVTLVSDGGDPAEIVEREGLGQMEDAGELEEIVARALEAEPAAAQKVRDGNMKAVGPLVGFVMRVTMGRAVGGEVTRLIREKLGS